MDKQVMPVSETSDILVFMVLAVITAFQGLIPTRSLILISDGKQLSRLMWVLIMDSLKTASPGKLIIMSKKTEDLLLSVPVPATSGYSTQMQNIGSVENKGFEFIINTNNLTGYFHMEYQFQLLI